MKNYNTKYINTKQTIIKSKKEEFKFSPNEILGIKGSLFLSLILGFLIGLMF